MSWSICLFNYLLLLAKEFLKIREEKSNNHVNDLNWVKLVHVVFTENQCKLTKNF